MSADTAAQHGARTIRPAPAGRCPSSTASDPKLSRQSGRLSAPAAPASAQEHTQPRNACPAEPEPALKEVQAQPLQTPFAAAALASFSSRSPEYYLRAPAAQGACPPASAEAPAAIPGLLAPSHCITSCLCMLNSISALRKLGQTDRPVLEAGTHATDAAAPMTSSVSAKAPSASPASPASWCSNHQPKTAMNR